MKVLNLANVRYKEIPDGSGTIIDNPAKAHQEFLSDSLNQEVFGIFGLSTKGEIVFRDYMTIKTFKQLSLGCDSIIKHSCLNNAKSVIIINGTDNLSKFNKYDKMNMEAFREYLAAFEIGLTDYILENGIEYRSLREEAMLDTKSELKINVDNLRLNLDIYNEQDAEIIERSKIELVNEKELKGRNAVEMVASELMASDREILSAVYYDKAGEAMFAHHISVGALDYTTAYIPNIFKPAFLSNAVALTLIHNHPSGFLEPSQSDYECFHKVDNACRKVGMELKDSLICAGNKLYSIGEQGTLTFPEPELPKGGNVSKEYNAGKEMG